MKEVEGGFAEWTAFSRLFSVFFFCRATPFRAPCPVFAPRSLRMSYRTGVFGCFDDVGTCLLGTCIPCYLTARTVGGEGKRPGEGINTLWCFLGTCCACVPCAAWVGRSKVQETYGIKEDILTRCALWW